MRTPSSLLTIILALLLLCLLSPPSCALIPRAYIANGGTLRNRSLKRTSKLTHTIRSGINSYYKRYGESDRRETSYSRRVGLRELQFNPKRQQRYPKLVTQVKQYSSLKSQFPDTRNKLNHNALREGHAQSRKQGVDTVPSKERQSSGGLGLEPCSEPLDCARTHSCAFADGDSGISSCDGRSGCICVHFDQDDLICSCAEPECLPGEQCASEGGDVGICVSTSLNLPPLDCSAGTSGSLEPCSTSSDCLESHLCASADDDGNVSFCDGASGCFCFPDDSEDFFCSCIEPECLPGDLCSNIRNSASVCVSLALSPTPLECSPDEEDASPDPPVPSPLDLPEPSPLDLAESSQLNSVEPSPLDPVEPSPLDPVEPSPVDLPEPSPLDLVESSPEDTTMETIPSTVPQSPSPTPSPTDEVCIDAQALSHLQSHQLVYQHHAVSRVLCDKFGSCATPGHIVHFNGSTMMMKKYCEIAGCEERVMEVNSPRYKKGMRVASKTEGLEYTVFAARYETRGEEAVLAAAVRMGL